MSQQTVIGSDPFGVRPSDCSDARKQLALGEREEALLLGADLVDVDVVVAGP